MAYACYDFYLSRYAGTLIGEDEFYTLATRASSFLDYFTQGRAAKNSGLEAVQMACCAIADEYKTIELAKRLAQKSLMAASDSDAGEIQSETVGGYSRTIRSGGDSSNAAVKSAAEVRGALADVAREYLAHTGLLYRGRCFACTPPTL